MPRALPRHRDLHRGLRVPARGALPSAARLPHAQGRRRALLVPRALTNSGTSRAGRVARRMGMASSPTTRTRPNRLLAVLLIAPVHGAGRRDDRQRRRAVDPRRPAHHRGRARARHRRLPDRLRGPAHHRRAARADPRLPARVPARRGRLHRRLAAVRPRARPDRADRRARGAGRRRGADVPPDADRHPADLRGRRARCGRSGCTRSRCRSAPWPARSWAACWSRPTSSAAQWRSIFFVNVPGGRWRVIAAGARHLPAREHGDRAARRVDVAGVATLSAAVLLVVVPLVLGRAEGWPAWTWLSLAASVPAFAGFVAAERRVRIRGGTPLVSLDAMAPRAVSSGMLAVAAATSTYYGLLFTLALYLQQGLGRSAARVRAHARLVGGGVRRRRSDRAAAAGAPRAARRARRLPAPRRRLRGAEREPVRRPARRGTARRAARSGRAGIGHAVQRADRPPDQRGLGGLRPRHQRRHHHHDDDRGGHRDRRLRHRVPEPRLRRLAPRTPSRSSPRASRRSPGSPRCWPTAPRAAPAVR